MAHIHLPDGVFSLQWVIIWWALALTVLAIALFFARRQTHSLQRLTIAALLVAVAFAIFQVNLPFAGGVHMNLTPLIGILAGPSIGSLVVLLVNILSAAIGHGGWGLIGANTLVNTSEVVSAYYLFYHATRRFELFTRGAVAAFGGLLVGNVLSVLIIVISGIQGSTLSGGALLVFTLQVPLLNLIVAVAEAIVTGFVVEYLGKVRHDLLTPRGAVGE
ncbi:MAG: energy-coupling factor ABC transporter permease [Halobacteriota archaeon]